MLEAIYPREFYLNKIRGFYHSDLIKVISGIRRCGKSFFLKSVIGDLQKNGVKADDIVYLNLDQRGFRRVDTPDKLEQLLFARIPENSTRKYVFIDEIQNVRDFEPVVNALREDGHSLFITGSNSYLLSGELATKLTGRYIEIEMLPLSFYEFLGMKKFLGQNTAENLTIEFTQYLRQGGLPKTLEFSGEEERQFYVKEIIEQIFVKDISARKKIKNRLLFEKVRTYIINNFGATFSVSAIVRYFRDKLQINVTNLTISNYLELLEKAKIIYRCPRFDLKSKKSLQTEQKYYLADMGIYYALNTDNRINYGPALENVMFTQFRAQGLRVSVGRIGKLECDFILRRDSTRYAYVQVAMSVADPVTEEREYRVLEKIPDNYPKYVFTLDPLPQERNGIKHLNIVEYLANPEPQLL